MNQIDMKKAQEAAAKFRAAGRYFKLTRKPSSWSAMDKIRVRDLANYAKIDIADFASWTFEEAFNDPNPRYPTAELTGLDDGDGNLPVSVFIITNGRDRYLVSTEGYSYPRYIAKIVDDTVTESDSTIHPMRNLVESMRQE